MDDRIVTLETKMMAAEDLLDKAESPEEVAGIVW